MIKSESPRIRRLLTTLYLLSSKKRCLFFAFLHFYLLSSLPLLPCRHVRCPETAPTRRNPHAVQQCHLLQPLHRSRLRCDHPTPCDGAPANLRPAGMFLAVYFISIRILLCACFSFAEALQELIALSSSKGSLLNSPGHMFMFGTTTLIFVLATLVIAVGTGLTSQGIPFIIRLIDPSFVIGWSPHKIDVVVGLIATITRVNACFHFFSSGLILWL